VKLSEPAVEVSIAVPFAGRPLQVATPDPPSVQE